MYSSSFPSLVLCFFVCFLTASLGRILKVLKNNLQSKEVGIDDDDDDEEDKKKHIK